MNEKELLQIIRNYKESRKKKSHLWRDLEGKVDKEKYDNFSGFVYKTNLSDEEILKKINKHGSFSNYISEEVNTNEEKPTSTKIENVKSSKLFEQFKAVVGILILLLLGLAIIYSLTMEPEETETDSSYSFDELTPEEIQERIDSYEDPKEHSDPYLWGR
jgi:hypothetical protein